MDPEFDQYAAEYSDLLHDSLRDGFTDDPAFFHRRKWLLIRDFFGRRRLNPSTISWLDVGCGQGELLRMAGGDFARSVGCDPSARMTQSCESIEIHRQISPRLLPFPERSFDFITAVCVYHHVLGNDREELTREVYRVLKPDGVFGIIEHNPWNPVTQMIVRRCPVDVNAELLTASVAAKLMHAAPLELLETEYFLYLPERIFRHLGALERPLRRLPLGGQYAIFGRKTELPPAL